MLDQIIADKAALRDVLPCLPLEMRDAGGRAGAHREGGTARGRTAGAGVGAGAGAGAGAGGPSGGSGAVSAPGLRGRKQQPRELAVELVLAPSCPRAPRLLPRFPPLISMVRTGGQAG